MIGSIAEQTNLLALMPQSKQQELEKQAEALLLWQMRF
jgi:hypothetical protein